MELLIECPICKLTKFTSYLKCKDNTVSHETFQLVQCSSCEFVFTNPRPDSQEIARYYQSDQYISHSNSTKGLFNVIYQKIRTIAIQNKIKMIEELNAPAKKILDYGCGTGEFLNAIHQKGWNCQGIEPSNEARLLATNNYSLSIFEPQHLSLINKNEFGIITLWHVLEHVHELTNTVQYLKNSLAQGGYLIIAVPNRNAWDADVYQEHWAAYDVPRHLYHFSKKNIVELISNLNFRLHSIKPMFFDPFYIDLLSEKYKTGRSNYFKAISNGIKTTMAGKKDITKNSSLIYIFKKESIN